MTIGHRLKTAREYRGISGRHLAARVGISHSGVYDVENGRAQNLSIGYAEKIALALDVPKAWFCFGEGPAPEWYREPPLSLPKRPHGRTATRKTR